MSTGFASLPIIMDLSIWIWIPIVLVIAVTAYSLWFLDRRGRRHSE